MSPAFVIPITLATRRSKNARISTVAGQNNSHFVYCSVSGFWQHFEGQHEGQQQQQHRNGQISRVMTKPKAKGPTKRPKSV